MIKQTGFGASIRLGGFLFAEKVLRWCVHPRLRAKLLGLLGAGCGHNVRVYESQFFNLESGFRNLVLDDDVHIGTGCRLDLVGNLHIGERSTLSPGVTILTHADPGASHGSRLCERYPPKISPVVIGSDCWLGANVTVLAGITIGDRTVVAAGSVVTNDVPSDVMVAGSPAIVKRRNA
jgi:acetyltransferase-like isoleucine patch superfamily enzyme